MGKGKLYRFSLFAFAYFASAGVALPSLQAQAQSSQAVHEPSNLLDLSIPSSAGYVVETAQAAKEESYPAVLIQIQEAHSNYEAQQNIASILEQLVKDRGLKLILVEGSSGDVGLSHMRALSPAEHRKQVADKYLRAGLLSGEEYLDLVSNYPLTLWGIEDKALYQENLEAFLASEKLQESLKGLVGEIQKAAEVLRPTMMGKDLNELDAEAKSFDHQQASLTDYASFIETLAARNNISLDAYPNLQRFLSLRSTEKAIKRAETQSEQQVLLSELAVKLSSDDTEALMGKASAMHDGSIEPIAFYAALESSAQTAGISLDKFPNLQKYVAYVKLSREVDTSALSSEIDACAVFLRKELASTSKSQQLGDILEALELINKLLALDLSPDEYQRFIAIDVKQAWPQWEQFLVEAFKQAEMPLSPEVLGGMNQVIEKLPVLQQFYTIAQKRDEVMVRNAVSKLKESGEPVAVLITGGFHSPRIGAMLKEQGIPTIRLIPKVSRLTDDRLYRAVVRYKSGRGSSFEEVMSLANRNQ